MSVKLILADYSKMSCVLYGDDTKEHKEYLKEIGGKWNPNLTLNGCQIKGWIFSVKKKVTILNFLESLRQPPFVDIVPVTEEKPKLMYSDKSTQTENDTPEDKFDTLTHDFADLLMGKIPVPKTDDLSFNCECGAKILKKSKERHLKTETHLRIVNKKE